MRRALTHRFQDEGLLDGEQVQQVLAQASSQGTSFCSAAVELGFLDEERLCDFLARAYGILLVRDLLERLDTHSAWKWLPEETARRHRALPLSRFEDVLTVGMANPFDIDAISAMEQASGCAVVPAMVLPQELGEATNRVYAHSDKLEGIVGLIPDGPASDLDTFHTFDLLDEIADSAEDGPVVKLVNSVLLRAVRERASDIHLEPDEKNSRVRKRVDGVLREMMLIPKQVHRALVSRIKVMGNMDIAERRVPQDGRTRIRIGDRETDLRISTVPSIYGEKVVIRILDYGVATTGLAEIGFEGQVLEQLRSALTQPNGIILVTGPTGSGKTTTLYAALSSLDTKAMNIITIEDPVEYNLPDINQIQVNVKAGITFGVGLRSLLRQDPDVIMVGEMRDLETAQMAIRAALTGHLVLSTLHTNDAPGALVRLVDMGVAPYLAASSVIAILAQRLVRRLCLRCRKSWTPTPASLEDLGARKLLAAQELFTSAGCPSCDGTGFKGRLAILELLTVSEPVRAGLTAGMSASELGAIARREGLVSLWDAGLEKVAAGLTSLEELTRVVLPPGVTPAQEPAR